MPLDGLTEEAQFFFRKASSNNADRGHMDRLRRRKTLRTDFA
jgi:hypothetical protein